MISPRLLTDLSRRAFVRISMTDTLGESSIKIWASDRAPMDCAMRGHSASFNSPVRSRYESTDASLHNKRVTSCCSDISREKIATGILYWIDACCAILRVSEVLPTPGLAAMMIKSDFWKPPVLASRSLNPLGTPEMTDWSL